MFIGLSIEKNNVYVIKNKELNALFLLLKRSDLMKLVTSESVFSGHPDKMCDQISDAILDAILEQDKKARVAVECAIKDDLVFIFGEVTTTTIVNYKEIAKQVIRDIGYEEEFNVQTRISEQSSDIALGVDEKEEHQQGAGDQGIMYGFACKESYELMPLSILVANRLSKRMDKLRKKKYSHIFGPDGKCQVTLRFDDKNVVMVDSIVFSAQTKPNIDEKTVMTIVIEEVILKTINANTLVNSKITINPTGKFEIGGPFADSGLTGRKIIVDTYGGCAKHGGGAFSGKDVSKVDRSAAYYARYVAKAVVKANLAEQCEVCVAYSIGVSQPVNVTVDTFYTGALSDKELTRIVNDAFDFSPTNIRKELELDSVKFRELATYGHIGREDLDVKWEQVDDKAKELVKLYEETERASQFL